jgi:HSP20 family molecular chaperone IbpA
MNPENEVSRAQADDGQGREPQNRASESGGVLRPPVDIFENAEGITLRADMPGVSKDRLNLRLDGPNLLVEGTIEIAPQGQMQALYADVRSAVYRRSFMLSNELEPDKIDANLKDGVLTVRIPKRAELRPRRIEVRTD